MGRVNKEHAVACEPVALLLSCCHPVPYPVEHVGHQVAATEVSLHGKHAVKGGGQGAFKYPQQTIC
jgi:hypothetical protein